MRNFENSQNKMIRSNEKGSKEILVKLLFVIYFLLTSFESFYFMLFICNSKLCAGWMHQY